MSTLHFYFYYYYNYISPLKVQIHNNLKMPNERDREDEDSLYREEEEGGRVLRGGQSVGGRDRSEVILLTRRRGTTVHHTHRHDTPQGKGGEASTISLYVCRSPMHVVASNYILFDYRHVVPVCLFLFSLSFSSKKKIFNTYNKRRFVKICPSS